jgi:transcriptional regulator with XRE-family HTH domain
MRQSDLAAMLGVDQSTVSQYESGRAAPSMPVLVRLYNLTLPPELKKVVHEHLVKDLNRQQPEHRELTEGVIESLASADAVMARFPSTKKKDRAAQLARFANLVPSIGQKPMLDKSVVDILEDWFWHGDTDTVQVFRDAAEYLRVRLEILAGVDPEELDHAETMRQVAKAARRLAIALLRQADIAEEKGRQVHPKVSGVKPTRTKKVCVGKD